MRPSHFRRVNWLRCYVLTLAYTLPTAYQLLLVSVSRFGARDSSCWISQDGEEGLSLLGMWMKATDSKI